MALNVRNLADEDEALYQISTGLGFSEDAVQVSRWVSTHNLFIVSIKFLSSFWAPFERPFWNLAQQGKFLPDHVHRELPAYLKCGRLEHGFLRVRTMKK